MLNIFKYHTTPQILTNYHNRTNLIPELAFDQAMKNKPNRSPKLEPTILKDPTFSYQYAQQIIQDKWPEAEHLIIQFPFLAFQYSIYILGYRWPEAEQVIKHDNQYWNMYKQLFNIQED